MVDNKFIGRSGLAVAITYYTLLGYSISLPLNDTQPYDLIIEKDYKLYMVQCKATQSKNNTISLRSCGGNNGKTHYYIKDTNIDILFCLDKYNNIFEIPLIDLQTYVNNTRITLNTKQSKNCQGFPTYKYFKCKFNMGRYASG